MKNGRVFVTGAFGNVGANVIKHLADQGYDIICFDLRTGPNESVARKLARTHQFKTVWGNLRDRQSVSQAMTEHQPDGILHIASIIAPIAYVMPDVAYDVNVNGTRYLIEAARRLQRPPKFVNVSSYTVHGPRNPYRNLPLMTGAEPFAPADNYATHKVIAEKMIANSGFEFTTVRLPAVMPTDLNWGRHPAFMKFNFLLCLEHQTHGIDSRDAALAIVNALSASEATGRSFVVAGPNDCRKTFREFVRAQVNMRGLKPFPDSAYRQADKNVDASWFSEGFVDTTESQAILKYQQHSFADYADYVNHQFRWIKPPLKLFGPIVQRQMLQNSLTVGKPIVVNSRPLWDIVVDRFGIDEKVTAGSDYSDFESDLIPGFD